MAKKTKRADSNPLQRTTKARTRAVADRAQRRDRTPSAEETTTGQGGSEKGGRKGADVDHPGQQGGITMLGGGLPRPNQRKGKRPGARTTRRGNPGAPAARTRRGKTSGRRASVRNSTTPRRTRARRSRS